MASLNSIVILGSLLNNPESRFSVDGLPIAKFELPVSSGFNQTTGRIEIVCFRKLAEICGQYLKKDSNVLVEGRLQVRSYEDQSGTRKWVTEIVAGNIQFMDKAEAPAKQVVHETAKEEDDVPELPEDDLPF